MNTHTIKLFILMCFLLFSCGNDNNNQDDNSSAPQNYEGLTTIQFRYSLSDEAIAKPSSYEAAIYDENDSKIFSKTWSSSEFSLALKNDENEDGDEDGLILLENVPAGQYRNLVILGKDENGATILRGEVEASISASQANPTIDIMAEDFKVTLLAPSDESVSTWETLPDFLWESSNAETYIIRIGSTTNDFLGKDIITESIDTNSYFPTALVSRISKGTVPEIITSSCPDTGQNNSFGYENSSTLFTFDQDYYGQDAHYSKFQQSYTAIEYDGKQLFETSDKPQKYYWDVIPVDKYGNVGVAPRRTFIFSIIWPITKDNNTGLMWTLKTQDDGSTHDTSTLFTWQEAHALLYEINSQAYCGFTDWRIPNVQELSCIFTCDSSQKNLQYFPNTSPAKYWTDVALNNYSTPFEPDVSVWCVDFADGKINEKNHSAVPARVRFVRGESITSILTDNGDGTISDSGSGLMWSKAVAGPMTWKEALQYCEKEFNDIYDDWRLPNRNELISIIDYSRSKSTTDPAAIDPLFVDSNYITNEDLCLQYWTATTDVNNAKNAYTVNFSYGDVSTNNKVFAENIMVRAVRYLP